MIKVLIADDHNMFLEGLLSLLGGIPNVEVVASAHDGEDVLRQLKSTEVDLLLLDINMPKKTGIEVLAELKNKKSQVKIALLSMHNDRSTIEAAMKAGADAYLLKNSSRAQLETAINEVYAGKNYFVDEVKDILISTFRSDNLSQEIRLTPREIEVLQLICEELTTAQIADRLFVSVNTVETHRKNLLSKTGAKNSVGLAKFAMQNGY